MLRIEFAPVAQLRAAIAALVGVTCFAALTTNASSAFAAPQATETLEATSRARAFDAVADVAVTALGDLKAFTVSGDSTTLAQYGILRDGIATALAGRLGIEPSRMIAAWQIADTPHQMALMAAFTQLGVPYRSMASKAGEGFDCSGLTTYAWGMAGATLLRQSGSQIKAASPRSAVTAMAGDLVYYPGHVMMFLGVDDAIVHSPYTGRNVEVDHAPSRRSLRWGNPIA